ncbi:MAG: acylglycerol kinase family protein, partial [Planctomycetota bacterium]
MELDVPASVRSLLLLTNSGSRRALEIRLQLESYLIDLPDTIEIIWKDVFTSPDPHLTTDRAVIVGGDGTVNLGLSWLKSSGLDVPVALVPAGTGNNLARGLGIPIEPAKAIELAFCTEETRCIDSVQLTYDEKTTGMMLQVAAAGMPALVAQRFDRLRHMPILSHPVR